MRVRPGQERKTCAFMMESLEQRQFLNAAIEDVSLTGDTEPQSEIVVAQAALAPLAAPVGVVATASFSTSIILGWTDQSDGESGHRIQRSTDGAVWETVGTVGPNVTSFQDTGLSPTSSYFYRVVAFDFVSEFASAPMTATTAAQALQVQYGASGLSRITYNGTTLFDLATSPMDGFKIAGYKYINADGSVVSADGQVGFTSSWNAETLTMTYAYAWWRLGVRYVQLPDRLNLVITVTNQSLKKILAGVNLFPFILKFPQVPTGLTPGVPHVGFNIDGPTAIAADWGSGTLVAANDDVAKPLYVGFYTSPETDAQGKFMYLVGSSPWWSQPGSWPQFDRPIAPGGTDTYTVSLRFGPTGATNMQLAPDIFAAALAQYPYQVNWTDRRPIGKGHLANFDIAGKSVKNPRGYFGGNFDVRTKAGKEEFRKQLMLWADNSVSVLKNMNAQGIIIWDLEGEQYPATTYVGDPRMLLTLAPEMEYRRAVDSFFRKFRDAGLRVGLTIRPQRLTLTKSGWKQMPVRNPFPNLAAKIQYARDRWKASMFYIDTNSWKTTYDASYFKRLQEAFPDVLLIPEHETTRYFAYTAPYEELRMGTASTPESALRAYPNAFSVINTAEGDIDGRRGELIAAVRRGDILMFQGWYNEPESVKVKSIYEEALGTGI